MSINEDRLHEIISCVAAKTGMKNWVYKIDETIHTYFCVLIPITLTGSLEDSDILQHMYVKLPIEDKLIKELGEYLWNTETYFYSTLLPLWQRLSNEKIDELIPRCYYVNATPSNPSLVLKNMNYEGFQSYKERFLDFEHVAVSLKSLAQFHALSFISNKDQEELMSIVLQPYTDVYPPELNVAVQNTLRTHGQLFKGSKYEKYWNQILANYKTVVVDGTSKAKCLLYGHGDCSTDNFIYKYKANKPEKACMVDFQTCRLMTPAHDFLFLLLTSTNGRLRRQSYHHFVTMYYECFKKTLFNHGIRLELLYKKDDFISDLKLVASLCFTRTCLAFSLWLGFEPNGLIKSKISWEDDQQRDKEICYFKEILIDVLDDLYKYEYISI